MGKHQDKAVRWSLAHLNSLPPDTKLYALTDAQANALIGVTSYQMRWSTRWLDGAIADTQQFADDLTGALMAPIDLCADVADCIDNNSLVQSAIAGQLANNPDIVQQLLNAGAGAYPSQTAQQNDAVWGASLSLAKWIQSTVVDVAEAVQAATELADAFVDALGVRGLTNLPVARVATFVTELSDAGAASIIAEADASSEETLACWIFNRIRCNEGGVYSFEALRDNTASLLADLGLGKALFGGAVVSLFSIVPESNFGRYYAIGLNNPDSDWSTLCDPCNATFTREFDFSGGLAQGWAAWNGRAQLTSTGWARVGSDDEVQINYTGTIASTQITQMRIVLDVPMSSGGGRRGVSFRAPNGSGSEFSIGDNDIGNVTDKTLAINANATSVFAKIDTQTIPNNSRIQKIFVSGTGSDPFP
jgi:hypothetical protein